MSLQTEGIRSRYEWSVTMLLGIKKKGLVVVPTFIWPNLFYLFKFMDVYLDSVLVCYKNREEYLVNFEQMFEVPRSKIFYGKQEKRSFLVVSKG